MVIKNPYADLSGGTWLKGQLHAHTNRTDGLHDPQDVLNRHRKRGYDFLSLADHDISTTEREYAALDANGLILIPGNEVTANGVHILHVNSNRRVEPDPDRQKVIDAINNDRGFAVINHPSWEQTEVEHCSIDLMRKLQRYIGMEIFNGRHVRANGDAYATNKWDMLLGEGRRVWGFANDDTHCDEDYFLGWNVAYVREKTPQAVIDALAQGRFYASTGVVIDDIRVEDNRIMVKTQNAQRIYAVVARGKRIKFSDSGRIEVTVPDNAKYMRFECWGEGDAFAWTQPFYVSP